MPIGGAVSVSINRLEDEFLKRYYRPQIDSAWFYRIFRTSDKKRFWLRPDYASSGSQSVRTRTFGMAFIHDTGSDEWGWEDDYVLLLKSKLIQGRKIPAYPLAIWLYREDFWPDGSRFSDIFEKFRKQFKLTTEEIEDLFDVSEPEAVSSEVLFSDHQFSWAKFTANSSVPSPPDTPQEEGGTLSQLELKGVGPAKEIHLDFAERTNLLTGDNGLGKSFILESAWWALSGNWTSFPALPREDASRSEPKISFQIAGTSGRGNLTESKYNWEVQEWVPPNERPTIPGLLIYAKVDGAFAVWDPARSYRKALNDSTSSNTKPIVFAREDVWNGLSRETGGRTTYISNGLIRDWINWQNNPNEETFEILKKVLLRLSPPSLELGDLGLLKPGDPRKVPGDSRWIPTIRHSYGEIPLVYASAGVRRIVALAYLIVWAWEEHKTQSEHIRKEPQKRMVILIDEIEAHLHPQWQRTILPALFEVWRDLNSSVKIQMIIATHSPLVMASIEPSFDVEKDKIFHIDLVKKGLAETEIKIKNPDFVVYGTVDSWLRSDIFELGQARSIEAEQAIEDAKLLQAQTNVSSQDVSEVSERLMKYLSAHDEFWPRWTYFASQSGVSL